MQYNSRSSVTFASPTFVEKHRLNRMHLFPQRLGILEIHLHHVQSCRQKCWICHRTRDAWSVGYRRRLSLTKFEVTESAIVLLLLVSIAAHL
jgi:hypothetical protein